MKCACGFEPPPNKKKTNGRKALNQHRRHCNAFWKAVHKEMGRIAVLLYGKPMAISMSEWNRYRDHLYPSWEGMRDWGKAWSDIQLESGLGVSSRGWGSRAQKGAIANDNALHRRMDEIAIADATTDERGDFAAILYRSGLPICEATYLRTGRMFVR